MDKFLLINAIITFIETRIKSKLDYRELAQATGFTVPYLRELFAASMGKSLYQYILERKIANAAFECRYTGKTLLAISMDYGFNNADAFTRAFKRMVGVTPSEFRKRNLAIQRVKLCAGVYGVGLPTLVLPETNYKRGVKSDGD